MDAADDEDHGAGGRLPSAVDSAVTLRAVHTAVGAGEFERIVFAFAGNDLPAYAIDYVTDRPAACGSGRESTGLVRRTSRFGSSRRTRTGLPPTRRSRPSTIAAGLAAPPFDA